MSSNNATVTKKLQQLPLETWHVKTNREIARLVRTSAIVVARYRVEYIGKLAVESCNKYTPKIARTKQSRIKKMIQAGYSTAYICRSCGVCKVDVDKHRRNK